jgi:DNA-binding response OmpR family regulator
MPCVPAELYARIRALEWRRSEFATEERLKIGALLVDRAAHEVSVEGRRVTLTAKEFALLAFLAANRGRVFSRETLLARVWGSRYEGGARTVDIHVRRSRRGRRCRWRPCAGRLLPRAGERSHRIAMTRRVMRWAPRSWPGAVRGSP